MEDKKTPWDMVNLIEFISNLQTVIGYIIANKLEQPILKEISGVQQYMRTMIQTMEHEENMIQYEEEKKKELNNTIEHA